MGGGIFLLFLNLASVLCTYSVHVVIIVHLTTLSLTQGTYRAQNSDSDECKPCPKGYYQDQAGETNCIK